MTDRTVDDCIADIVGATDLKKPDVKSIADLLNRKAKELRDQGLTDVQVADQIRQIGALSAKKLRTTAALKRKQAAINARVLRERHAQLDALIARGVGLNKAVRAMLTGDNSQGAGTKNSVAGMRRAYEADWLTGFMGRIQREMPHVVTMMAPRKRDLLRKAAKGERMRTDADALWDDVAREWRKPGSTESEDAAKLAQIAKETAEEVRQEQNRLGANIGSIDDWGGPQSHDALRVMRAGYEKWRAAIEPRLDRNRTFGEAATDDDVRQFLEKAYNNIVVESPVRDTPKGGDRPGPASLARGLEHERVLHFKSADDWISYNREFGRTGGLREALLGHFAQSARTASLMHHFGPNPEAMLDRIIKERVKRIDDDASLSPEQKRKLVDGLRDETLDGQSFVGLAWAEVSGRNDQAYMASWARFGANARAVQSMAKLGGAVLSAVNDLSAYGARMNQHGRGFLPGIQDAIMRMRENIPEKEKRYLDLALAAGNDGVMGDVADRFMPEDQLTGRMQAATTAFFRLSGLTAWTDMNTASFARSMSAYMAARAGDAFEDLGKFGDVLKIYDIGPDDWSKVSGAIEKIGDHHFFLPEKLRGVDAKTLPAYAATRDEALAQFALGRDSLRAKRTKEIDDTADLHRRRATDDMQNRMAQAKSDAGRAQAKRWRDQRFATIDKKRQEKLANLDAQLKALEAKNATKAENEAVEAAERARRDLELKFRLAIASEAETGVIQVGDETRMITRAGLRRGTIQGEIARFMAQFKSFPIAFTQKVLNPAIQSARRRDEDAIEHLAQLIVYSTIAGYIATVAKDFAANRTPKDPTDWRTFMAAFLRGGGAGLYGDFLFANSNKYGNSFAETMAGPFPSEVGTLLGAVGDISKGEVRASDAFHFALGNTPYANLWFLRGALDLAIFNAMQEAMSPGTFRRREQRMERDFGQSYIVDPVQ